MAVACGRSPRSARRPVGPSLQLAFVRHDAGTARRPRPLEVPPTPRPPRMFRLDRAHTGRTGYVLPRHPRVVARLTTRARISAQPVAHGDAGVAVGSHDGTLYAGTRDGGVRWRVATGDRIYTTPALTEDGTLYVGTDADRLLAVSARGATRVALGTNDDADTSPVVGVDNSVRFASGRTLYATDADLTVRWRLDVGAKIFSSPALTVDGVAVFGSQDNHVYAVNADGTVRWRFTANDDVDATPMLDANGNVYVGSDDGNVYALTRDGNERWRRAVGGYVRAGAGLGLDGNILVPTHGPRPRLVALDPDDGHEVWSFSVNGPPTREYGIASAPLIDGDGRIAFGSPDDALYILDKDGTHPVRVPMPADVDSAPVLLDDRVLAVGCDDGVLYILGE